MATQKISLDQADYSKAEADAMRVLGSIARSTKTEPEHRIAAANAMLMHLDRIAVDEYDVKYETVTEVEEVND